MNIKRGLHSQPWYINSKCVCKENESRKNVYTWNILSLRIIWIRACYPSTCEAALVTISPPIRSGPSFPRFMSLWPASPVRREASRDLGARSETRPLSCSSSEPRSPQIRSVRKFNTRLDPYFKAKRSLLYIHSHIHAHQIPREQKKHWLTQTITLMPERPRAGAATDGWILPLCARPSYPRRNPGSKRPTTFPPRRTQAKFLH